MPRSPGLKSITTLLNSWRKEESKKNKKEEEEEYPYQCYKRDNVETPAWLYDDLNKRFEFKFDPCPLRAQFNSLSPDVEWKSPCYVNPPYSRLKDWIPKCAEEASKEKVLVLLIPMSYTTNYWNDFIITNPRAKVYAYVKRLIFPPFKRPMILPMCIVTFNDNENCIEKTEMYKRKELLRCFY
jgi:hypothetical protein